MIKKISFLTLICTLFFAAICEQAFARAGGRSSFSGGRSSSSFYNQGSRGSRTYEGGGAGGKNYSSMQKSATNVSGQGAAGSAQQQNGARNQQNTAQQNAPQQPNRASSFFQRNPMLSTFGAALAGSWIGHMLFGNGGFGGYGAGGMGGGGGMMVNLLLMALGAFAVVMMMRFLNRQSDSPAYSNAMSQGNVGASSYNHDNSPQYHQQQNFSQPRATNFELNLSENDSQKFSEILVEVQNAWSHQDLEKLKKLTTPEMLKYFTDSLSQNVSQDIANKVENVELISGNPAESWREDEMEYATAILEWSALDYVVNLNKSPSDADYVIEGSDKNLIITSEAWTFTRYGENGRWILSAIAQVE